MWKELQNVKIDLNAPKDGVRVNSFYGLGLWDLFMAYRDLKLSNYKFAPYILEDEDGMFTIGEGKNGWFAKHKHWKTYQSGTKTGKKENISKEDYNYWKREAEALWGRVDFLGNFVPGLLNPKLDDGSI